MANDEHRPEPAGHSLSSTSPTATVPGSLVRVRADWIDFYDVHSPRLVRFMMHIGASLADAHDAAQEAFPESGKLMSRDPTAWQAISGKAAWIRTTARRR